VSPGAGGPRGAARYPKDRHRAPTLLVAETFISIEGEGPEQGFPTFFIRLTGCNLRCSYCDSAHAFFEGTRRLLDDVVEEARRSGTGRVLVTGGEPLCQAATPLLCRELARLGLIVSIETNGSMSLAGLPAAVRKVVDVKAPGSGEGGAFLPGILGQLRRGDALKFVISHREDYLWTRSFLGEYTIPAGVEVLLSPAWGAMDPGVLAGWILEDRAQVRFQIQLHKVLWGDKRGV
jgi:7-carboxy-7-deazaguanine synthase